MDADDSGTSKESRRRGDKESKETEVVDVTCSRLPLSPSPRSRCLLYPQPQAMEVVCVAPDGPPQFVWLENRRERIVALRGTGADRNVVVARAHRCGAIIIASPPNRAATCGSSAGSRTGAGSCMAIFA